MALSVSDGTYSIDYASQSLGGQQRAGPKDYMSVHSNANSLLSAPATPSASGAATPGVEADEVPEIVANHFIETICSYSFEHNCKFYGVGITQTLASMSPKLPSRLWAELDIVPLVFEHGTDYPVANKKHTPSAGEDADSMARKCCMFFGPTGQPRLQVGFQNEVEVDVGEHVRLATMDMYKLTVHLNTWLAAMHYAKDLKSRKVKIAFFNTTPQGGGVALMRHALIRFFRIIGVEASW